MTSPATKSPGGLILTLVPAFLLVAAAAGGLWYSPEARESAWQAFVLIFTFFTTPFILETSVAILGFIAVLSWNHWRMTKEGDGWVEMEVPAKSPEPADKAPIP